MDSSVDGEKARKAAFFEGLEAAMKADIEWFHSEGMSYEEAAAEVTRLLNEYEEEQGSGRTWAIDIEWKQ